MKLREKMNKDIKGYIFDFGGTLDTGGCHWGKFIWHSYERNAVPVDWESFREAYVYAERELGKGDIIRCEHTFHDTLAIKLRLQMDYLRGHGALKREEVDVPATCDLLLDDVYMAARKQIEESKDVLAVLSRRVPLVLVSNFYGNLPTVIHEMGLDGCFQKVVESAAVGIRKPDPRIFSLALSDLGLPGSDVVVVGDSLKNDILPADSLGCQTVWLKGEGWNNDSYLPPLQTRVVASLSELTDDI